MWSTVKKALTNAGVKAKEQADKKRKSSKPFTIIKIINPVTVKLQLPRFLGKIHPVFHSSLLKPVSEYRATTLPGPIAGDQYEVQEILDSQLRRGRLYYLVLWRGYPLSEASWVADADVQAPRLIRKFHMWYPGKPGARIVQTNVVS
ncbi:LHP1: putative chromo domain-containing protein LHP1 [Crotalus adamanteus]|uniref:LHP1: putative chromo domain-containing protein LHP1 n=1 Tax=Crotalus adamanteus TaxID=8729 RepID=A0AAW1BCT7_CROAD